MSSTTGHTLAEVVDQYLAMRSIDKKKYYPGYLISAKWAWKHLFRNTMFSTQSEWMPLKKGSPLNYIDVPKGLVRLFTVCELDPCKNIVPLYYNSELTVKARPTVKKCGCKDDCGCGSGLCEDIASVTKTTKLLFTINNVDYYETDYIKLCPNGDIIEYREVPTKKYNDFAGDTGDYQYDYSYDWWIGYPPFSDFTITTEIFQNVLCNLELAPCGCPVNTPENVDKFTNFCGAFLPCFNERFRKHCEHTYLHTNLNTHCYGEIKMGECGTKIYYKPYPRRVIQTSINSNLPTQTLIENTPLPDYLLVNYQTSGEDCSVMVEVPELAVEAMFTGIDYYTKRFNNMFSPLEKRESKYLWVAAQNDLILDLNVFNLTILSNIQDAPIVW